MPLTGKQQEQKNRPQFHIWFETQPNVYQDLDAQDFFVPLVNIGELLVGFLQNRPIEIFIYKIERGYCVDLFSSRILHPERYNSLAPLHITNQILLLENFHVEQKVQPCHS